MLFLFSVQLRNKYDDDNNLMDGSGICGFDGSSQLRVGQIYEMLLLLFLLMLLPSRQIY